MDYFIKLILFYCLTTAVSCAPETCLPNVKCVRLEECSELLRQFISDRSATLPLIKRLNCGFIDKTIPKVCCPNEYFTTSAPLLYDFLLPNISVCGLQNADRVVGGSKTDIEEHPWMALLGYVKPNKTPNKMELGYHCGGVLISPRYILTAAHCVKGELMQTWNLTQVRLGEWNMTSAKDCNNGFCNPAAIDVPIQEAVAHELYDPDDDNQHNDIAILRLSRDVVFTDTVKPICLPSSSDLLKNTFEGFDVEAAGWGKTENASNSDVKLKVRLPVIPRNQCEQQYKTAGRIVNDKQLCAGGIDGKDSCRGDSGGPLMSQIPSKENWIAIGVISYGPTPCGTAGWPAIYTRVTSYINWIQSKMRP